jgi:hypothetical protein
MALIVGCWLVLQDAARASAKACPRGACATDAGGPGAFSEIQKTNYYGVSHFPCCITNFPQGEQLASGESFLCSCVVV